ncbi:MAG TPA: molybdopterin molybdenumtransferase MoeA [Leucothrix sp.]|nr:molybdopterin molybdenumtransferase MoeA [Leucothrix sp.]
MAKPDDVNHQDNNCDSGQKLMPIEEALQLLIKNVNPITETETLPLNEAQGRILAEDISSTINVPPADNSAMDGYAIRSADFSDSNETQRPISQRITAGMMGTTLETGTVARIFTGAPVPEGADAVVMQEVCTIVDNKTANNNIKITGPVPIGNNIRKAGEDIAIGDTVLKTGIKLKPQDIGLIASVGIGGIAVYKRLRVGIFFTGDELREPGETLKPGQIYNSNRHTLRGLLENLNCDVIDFGTVEDTLEATKTAMLKAAKNTDLVMTSGGVSVGEEDYVRIALEEMGQLKLWRINIKPGKPLAFGSLNTKNGAKPFLGMPGNPVSVFATFCIFARPFILEKQGASETQANSFMVSADFEWTKAGKRHEYVRARVEGNVIKLFPHQGSGVLTSTSWANGLAVIPEGITVKFGDLVEFIPFSELSVV